MSEPRQHLTMDQQAALLDRLLATTKNRNGSTASETMLVIRAEDVDDLEHIARRLRMMGLHEPEIRKLVQRKGSR